MFSSNENAEKKPQMSNSEAGAWGIMALGFIVVFFFHKNAIKIERWYFSYFEEIYLSIYILFIALLAYLVYAFKKKTSDIDDRAKLFSPFWNEDTDKIITGTTEDKVDIHLSDKQRCSHVQVIGTTGSGKSESVVIPWAIRDVKRGLSSIIIDGKGSVDLASKIFLKLSNAKIDCSMYNFNLGDISKSVRSNPLMYGTAGQITDRIFSSFEFEQSYYRDVQKDICGYLISLIHKTHNVVTFKLLHELLTDDSKLAQLLSSLDDSDALKEVLKKFLREPVRERKNNLSGLVSQIAPFAIGEVSEFVNVNCSYIHNVLLSNPSPQCLVFSIPTLKYQKLGHQLGKLFIQELAWCVSKREEMRSKEFVSVILDEFSEFVYEDFISVLNKARSAKVGMHLCHQALSDLTKVSNSFARGVNTNTNIKCILGLNDPETADFYARHFGTTKTEKLTEQVQEKGFFKNKEETGRGSMRIVEEYRVHPNELKELYEGDGVIHFPSKNGTVTERIKYRAISNKELFIE